jgi:excisionase family DNA binding protein
VFADAPTTLPRIGSKVLENRHHQEEHPMSASQNLPLAVVSSNGRRNQPESPDHFQREIESPMTVKEAAKFLGVSPQTVYLWAERKQIPHLRVMGRNIRFLKSDLEPFRASFRQEMVNV